MKTPFDKIREGLEESNFKVEVKETMIMDKYVGDTIIIKNPGINSHLLFDEKGILNAILTKTMSDLVNTSVTIKPQYTI